MYSLSTLVNVENPAFELYSRYFVIGIGRICDITFSMSIVYGFAPEALCGLLPISFKSRWAFALEHAVKFLSLCVPTWYAARFALPNAFTPRKRPFMHPFLQRAVAFAATGGIFLASNLARITLNAVHPMASSLAIGGLYYSFRWVLPLAGVISLDRGIDLATALIGRYLVVPCRRMIMSQRSDSFQRLLDDQMKLPPFKYIPLQSSTMIRLLKFQREETDPSQVTCEIVAVELNLAPPYDAVSYVWGNPTASSSLILGSSRNSSVAITENACRVLAAVTPLEGTRHIWIDSICIDQSNEGEKAQQVPVMSKIYTSAEEVVVFLNNSPDADAAIAFISRLVYFSLGRATIFDWDDIRDIGKAITTAPPIPVDDPGWEALKNLVRNEYWSRLWIVQECVAAKELKIIYGNSPCDWDLFSRALLLMIDPSYLFQSKQLTPPYAVSHILGITVSRVAYLGGNSMLPLSRLVSAFGVARASFPADRVNALLSISEDFAESSLQPNYQKSTRQVYTDMVRHALSRGHFDTFAVAGLCNPRSGSKLSDLPSWVPDLTCPVLCRIHHYHTRGYEAGTNIHSEFEISPDGYKLKLKGVLFDTVRICSSDPDWAEIELDSLRSKGSIHELGLFPIRRVPEMRKLAKDHLPPKYYGQQELDEAFWRTIVEDYDGSSHPSKLNFLRGIEILEAIWRWYDQKQEASDYCRNIIWAEDSQTPTIDGEDWVQIGRIVNVLRYKTFAITEKGYMAMVPPDTKPGYVVAIILGCAVPQVLRRTDDNDGCYFHWGEAYVHGIMNGEGLGGEQEWLVLR